MKTYARLQHSRMHSDPQGLSTFFNGGQSCGEGMANDNGGGGGGGGSYRVGAAVQRAMAMRERHSISSNKSEDIKGIGGMRDVYMSSLTRSPPPHCNGYFSQVTEEDIICSAMGAQSMKYTRFCPDPDVNGLNQDFGHVSNGKRKLQIGGDYSCDEDVRKNQGVGKKSFVTRLCRQLFCRRKKSEF